MEHSIGRKINDSLPNGLRHPAPIQLIFDYLGVYGYPISGCFEVAKLGNVELDSWFHGDTSMTDRLMVFGRGATGEIYALWLEGTNEPNCAPVVMLGSEGEFLVLAINSREFVRLLCIGYSELGVSDMAETISDSAESRRFREYMIGHLGINVPSSGESIVNTAKDSYPNFATWVEDWLESGPTK